MKNILLIEDNRTKANDIKKFLEEYSPFNIIIKESLTSGLRELFSKEYDLLLLDMSLPTREGALNNTINNFEQLGGHRILSEMKRKNKQIPTALITMFSEFGIGESFLNIEDLDEKLNKNFPSFYKGYIFYSSQEDNWKNNLKLIIDDCL
ncbi:response regulator [Moheibacter sediminis]|uniref:Response regulator receiver domain-containing protein n=1 Tax=Moheibacter sediminis TaxID=1434700 RepID=A0A1W1YBY8_9FLAO|nr:response regulator [Moheibacter sediminis]SMC33634.1 Response regulator receiver domain-containing protein [Moheibacter sediminis]